jgi:hypothetical protein
MLVHLLILWILICIVYMLTTTIMSGLHLTNTVDRNNKNYMSNKEGHHLMDKMSYLNYNQFALNNGATSKMNPSSSPPSLNNGALMDLDN